MPEPVPTPSPQLNFIPFRFDVTLIDEKTKNVLCQGQFSEVSGLELIMEPRAIAVGGINTGELQRVGPTRYAPIILKRGVTNINDLWEWFDKTTRGQNYGYRLQGEIRIIGPETENDGKEKVFKPAMVWKIKKALPTRYRGPDLSATASQVAIEELELVHEGLTLESK